MISVPENSPLHDLRHQIGMRDFAVSDRRRYGEIRKRRPRGPAWGENGPSPQRLRCGKHKIAVAQANLLSLKRIGMAASIDGRDMHSPDSHNLLGWSLSPFVDAEG